MTARQVFEATLIELSKVQAPSLKLYEFNYLFNKAINQYINKVYNVYDINQQTTDDLRVLKSSAYLTPTKYNLGNNDSAIHNVGGSTTSTELSSGTVNSFSKSSEGIVYKTSETRAIADGKTTITITKYYYIGTKTNYDEIVADTTVSSWKQIDSDVVVNDNTTGQATSYLSSKHRSIQSLHGATYEVEMPVDYLHMLNCVCIYYVAKTKDCWDAGSYIEVPATRLTADSWSQIVTDIYNRPSPMRPYYYIHNIAGTTDFNDYYKVTNNGTSDASGNITKDGDSKSNFDRTFKLNDTTNASVVEKPIASRVGNASKVRCEIRYGKKLNKNARFC